MVVLGLLLIAASVTVTIAVVVANTNETIVEAFGQNFTGVTLGGLFLVGCAVGALALLGLWMIMAGLQRSRRRRIQDRHVVKATRTRAEELQDENTQLRTRLEEDPEPPTVDERHPHLAADEPDTGLTQEQHHEGIAGRGDGGDGGDGDDRGRTGDGSQLRASAYAERGVDTPTAGGAAYPNDRARRDATTSDEKGGAKSRRNLLGRDHR